MGNKFIAGFIVLSSLGLGGCWTSATPLMTEDVKDAIPIRGTFKAIAPGNAENYYTIRKSGDRAYDVIEFKAGKSEFSGTQSFDFLEALPPKNNRIGGGYYLVQHDFNDPGSNRFAYSVAAVEIGSEGDVFLNSYIATCPPSLSRNEQAKGTACPLNSYAEAQKMGRETIAWIKEARAVIHVVEFRTTDVPPEVKIEGN